MKKILFSVCLMLTASLASAQQGLENIIVEKYYVSNAADSIEASGNGDELPVGSVTYRIYVDMLPGYKFQAAFGTQDNSNIPVHTLVLSTTTSFYNNTDRGHEIPSYSKSNAAQNTVMLDSWFSAGAACSGSHGILKADDNAAGGTNVINASGVLQNNDPVAGIPLTTADGIYTKVPNPSAVTFVNMAQAQSDFDGGPSTNSFVTSNASWASLVGATGPTTDNRVLIGQFTTDGCFHFELNIQIGTPAGGTQIYVASNPTGNEILFPACIYPLAANSNASVSITKNPSGPVCEGTLVTFTATPLNGGNAPSYQWIKNGNIVGSNSATYSDNSLTSSDSISCVMTSNATCINGNPATAVSSVTVNPLPVVTAQSVSGCDGISIALSGLPVGGTFSEANPYSGPSTTYSYSYTDGNGCSNTSAVANITVNPLPGAITGADQNICSGNIVTIGALPIAGSTYSWTPASDLSSDTMSNPDANPATTTVYTLTETISSTGCTKSNSVTVFVTPAPTPLSTTNINGTNALASWTSVGPGYSYFVEKRPVGAANFDQGWTTTNTSWQFVNMTPNTNYEWHVRTICGPGQFSNWSALQPFVTTNDVCTNTPSGLFTNAITVSSAKINWNLMSPVPNFYQIRYRVIGTTQWIYKTGQGTSSKRLLTGLTPSSNYQWQIRGKCGTSAPFNYSNWSALSTFTTAGSTREGISINDITVAVYPNPTSGVLTLSVPDCDNCNYQVALIDAIGKVVYSEMIQVQDNYAALDFSNLPQGFYFLNVENADSKNVLKVVLQ